MKFCKLYSIVVDIYSQLSIIVHIVFNYLFNYLLPQKHENCKICGSLRAVFVTKNLYKKRRLSKMAKTLKNKIPVSVGIPFDLLSLIDEKAKENDLSRSDYVVQALREKVEQERAKEN
jgi:hypothetical protein